MSDHEDVDQPGFDRRIDFKYLAKALLKYQASDIHLKVGRPPLFRINGSLVPAKMADLTEEQMQFILFNVMRPQQIDHLEKQLQVDFSIQIQSSGRFRCSVFYQRGTLSAAVRMIPIAVPNIESLGVPEVVKDLALRRQGLVLVTGATGSGKSTTLAAMLQYINENRSGHILTIEDPIEYVFRDGKSSFSQREVGSDVPNFPAALRSGLRQDPDVIVVGEMRDLETIQIALTAAETGHLVLSTLHTNDARSTVERLVDVFPAEAKAQIRIQLASTLAGVISQQLIPRQQNGRVLCSEVLVCSPSVEESILNNETTRIQQLIESSNDYYKMQSFNQNLEKLIQSGDISLNEALKHSPSPEDLKLKMAGIAREEGYDLAIIKSA